MGHPEKPQVFRYILMEEINREILNIEISFTGFRNGREVCRLLPSHIGQCSLWGTCSSEGIKRYRKKQTLLIALSRLQPALGGTVKIDGT
jgi:hypothetical protein